MKIYLSTIINQVVLVNNVEFYKSSYARCLIAKASRRSVYKQEMLQCVTNAPEAPLSRVADHL